ncbi:MAG: PTS sugar transporter subunit IIA [Spirochaetales bacterium]|nr:PTS sugar transporter subunit IIA [Spirochaetales bacterium]
MLREVLSPDLVTTDLAGTDKRSVIESLIAILVEHGGLADAETALGDVLDHENNTSTGMEHGIAIPHAKTDAVDSLVACIGVTRKKIDFDSLDRKPSQIFVMTLSPRDGTGPHVQFLAEVSRLLKDGKIRKRMLKAKSNEELYSIFVS